MKYWLYFTGKVLLAAGLLQGLWRGMAAWLPDPAPFYHFRYSRFGQDLPWTFAILVYFLIAAGLVVLAVIDQRYRCRQCLRRLRMPVETGSWSNVLRLGPPKTEYICPFGHGTLKVPELQITGMQLPDWKSNQDIWKELESLEETRP